MRLNHDKKPIVHLSFSLFLGRFDPISTYHKYITNVSHPNIKVKGTFKMRSHNIIFPFIKVSEMRTWLGSAAY